MQELKDNFAKSMEDIGDKAFMNGERSGRYERAKELDVDEATLHDVVFLMEYSYFDDFAPAMTKESWDYFLRLPNFYGYAEKGEFGLEPENA